MAKLQSVRGTNDILPPATVQWHSVESTLRHIAELYGFQEVRTPVFEYTELFARGIGETTDVVSKEMYTFHDLGNESLTLRPEATAGLIRAAIEHSLVEKNPVVRLWALGPMFRQERPQKGRYRQFHQFDAELLGSAQPEADAEVIAFAYHLVCELGLSAFDIHLNSLGNAASRAAYREQLLAHFRPVKEHLSADSQSRLERNPLRILDSKHPDDAEFVQTAPALADALDDESKRYFEDVQHLLSAMGVPFVLNNRLVRGLDYYCHTAFELVTTKLGSQNAIGGGGRYDGLFEQLGGKPTPGVGFAFGMERVMLLLEEEGALLAVNAACDLYIVALDKDSRSMAAALVFALRKRGFAVQSDVLARSFKAQMRDADRTQARFVLIIGEQERHSGKGILKSMATGDQQEHVLNDIDGLAAQLRLLPAGA
jgi:histidyl-tRNA synthetase